LESVFRGNSNVGSNPTLSAIFQLLNPAKNQLYSAGSSLMVAGGHSD
jgi:hypothetical protein